MKTETLSPEGFPDTDSLRREYKDLVRAVKIDDAATGPSAQTLINMVKRMDQIRELLGMNDALTREERQEIY